MAYVTAATHGFTEQAEALGAQLEAAGLPLPTSPVRRAEAAVPGAADHARGELAAPHDLEGHVRRARSAAPPAAPAPPTASTRRALDLGDDGLGGGDGWGDDLDAALGGGGDGLGGGGGGGLGDEDGLGGDELGGEAAATARRGATTSTSGDVALPSGGGGGGGDAGGADGGAQPLTQKWSRDSNLIADHAAAGSFETAMR